MGFQYLNSMIGKNRNKTQGKFWEMITDDLFFCHGFYNPNMVYS